MSDGLQLAPMATGSEHANGDSASVLQRSVRNLNNVPLLSATVRISTLQPADSPRFGGVDSEHAEMLAEVEADLPPILVRRATMRVVDGMHRLRAAQLRGQETIAVQFFDGNEEEAFLLAVQSNIAHGLPLKIAERRSAASRIIRARPDMSDRSIALVVGLAAKTVASVRRSSDDAPSSDVRLGRDGRVRPVNPAEGRRIAGKLFTDQPHASVSKIARAAGVSVGTARDVRERILRGDDPILPRHRPRSPDLVRAGRREAALRLRASEMVDHNSILENLRRDPALRYSESGRSVLRWLTMRAISNSDWSEILDDIPPHCAIVVARIARSTAVVWTEFAGALDQRVQACSA